MDVILLRHGQTAGNRRGSYIGRTDEPLCDEGFHQAAAAGVRTDVPRVFVSPLQRARQTASVCFPRAAQIVIEDLREMDFGDFEGRTADEMESDAAYRGWVDGNCEGACPNGERIDLFQKRVAAAFDEAVRDAIRAGDTQLFIVAHGGTIMAILSAFTRSPISYSDWHVKNCCGWRAVLDESAWQNVPQLTDYRRFERLPL